jgi:hypothetical protein
MERCGCPDFKGVYGGETGVELSAPAPKSPEGASYYFLVGCWLFVVRWSLLRPPTRYKTRVLVVVGVLSNNQRNPKAISS